MNPKATALLFYGHRLGGPERGWSVRERNSDGTLPPLDWYDPANEYIDFREFARARLAAVPGVTVERHHCTTGTPEYALTAHTLATDLGPTSCLDLAGLVRMELEQDWDDKLATAVRTLGLTPLSPRPMWHLAVRHES